jgi:hypothetical protein
MNNPPCKPTMSHCQPLTEITGQRVEKDERTGELELECAVEYLPTIAKPWVLSPALQVGIGTDKQSTFQFSCLEISSKDVLV